MNVCREPLRRHLRWRGIAALASLARNFRWARLWSEAANSWKRDSLLNDQRTQLHSLVANSSAVISLKDLQGRFILVNDRYTKPYPGMQGRWAGTTAERWFPPAVAASIAASDARVAAFGQPMTFEEVVPHDDGPHAYVTIKFPVKDATGTMVGVGSISTDVTELKEAQVAIEQKEQMLRKLIEVQESEKQSICHDIHDGMLQYVIAAKMLLDSYVEQQPKLAGSLITQAIDCLGKSIEEARQVVRGVRSAVLDDLGFSAAIEDLCDQFTVSGFGVTTSLAADFGDVPLALQTTAFRLVQEALANARKHSRAASVAVEVSRSDDGLWLTVRDDGCGFEIAAIRGQGFGLMGMRERVRLAGGEVRIDSSPGQGTTITARLPVPKHEPIETPARTDVANGTVAGFEPAISGR